MTREQARAICRGVIEPGPETALRFCPPWLLRPSAAWPRFSTRLGGVSTGIYASLNLGSTRGDDPDCVRENYRRFFQAAIGADLTQVAMSNQVHGDVVRPVTSADRQAGPL